MFRKNYFTSLLLVTIFLLAGVTVFAQATKSVGGKVEMKKEDGSTVPVKDAVVDLIRVDKVGRLPENKTDETGSFVFPEVPEGGVYALSISGAGLTPEIITDVKAGMDTFTIPVTAGDSKRYTEEQVRLSYINSIKESGKLTDEQKKMLKDFEDRILNSDQKFAAVTKALKEGNAAYESKNYDIALAKYDEGINADPEFVGSAPILLNNKGQVLRLRAVDMYNEAVKSGDGNKIKEAKKQIGKDLGDAINAYNKSYVILKNASADEVKDQANHKKNIYNAADGGRDAIRLMSEMKIAATPNAEAAANLTQAYLEFENDKAKKGKAQASLASYLMDAGDYEGAVAQYKKAIEITPDDADVLAGISLALFTAAEDKKSAQMKQESLNYMDKFLRVAPKNHSLRDDIDGLATYLKTQEKLKPQKIN